MSNVMEDLPIRYREVVIQVIGDADPQLLAELQSGKSLTRDQQDTVEGLLYSEFAKNIRSGHEPNGRGVLISSTINAFANWFIDHCEETPADE